MAIRILDIFQWDKDAERIDEVRVVGKECRHGGSKRRRPVLFQCELLREAGFREVDIPAQE